MSNVNKYGTTSTPLVSIITVVFNNVNYLQQTIESVLTQNYKNIEYLIIDGGSTDGTLDLIQEYETQIDYWVSELDNGLYDAMNKGIELAQGELIGILNSDDLYLKHTVSSIVDQYQKLRTPCVIYGDMVKFYEGDLFNVVYQSGNLSSSAFKNLRICINHPTCFVHKILYKEFGKFNTKFELGADRDLMIRFYNHKVQFVYINHVLAKFRLGGLTSQQSLPHIKRALIQEYQLLKVHEVSFNQTLYLLFLKTCDRLKKFALYKIFGDRLSNKLIIFYLNLKKKYFF